MIKKPILFIFLISNLFANPDQNSNNTNLYPVDFLIADTVFYDDFENGIADWTLMNIGSPSSNSLWHLTEIRSVSQTHSIGWQDSITNSYPHLSSEALISPSILVPSNAKVHLSFDVFIHLAPNGSNNTDFFDIDITTDNGSTWNNFSQYAYSGQQIGWKNFPFDYAPAETGDLTSFAGKNIKFRFIVSTDNLDPNGEGVFIDNFRIVKVDCEFPDPFEPNNNLSQATPVLQGQLLQAALCPVGDQDFYSFTVSQHDRINLITEHNVFQINMALYSPAGTLVASTGNKQLFYNAATGGVYKVRISLSDIFNYTLSYRLYVNVINTKPDLVSVTDIPDDEGLKVRVQWQYSIFDPPDSTSSIKDYHLFRKVDDSAAFGRNVLRIEDIADMDNFSGSIILAGSGYWDYVATVPAISPRPFSNYSLTAPTLKDSIESTFMVAAVNKVQGQPVLWGSEGSGMSADNISPQFESYSVLPGTNGITLNWDINNNIYSDLMDVKIYKGMFERFAPETENVIASLNPALSSFTDEEIIPGETYYYKLSLSDFSGNKTYTTDVTGSVTSVGNNIKLPEKFSLQQNYPNPFNPVTVIEFSIPFAEEINLKVYNILGIEVAELARGKYAPGNYKISFDAASIKGGLSSGIYLYTLTAGEYSETKKLMLLK